MSSINEFNKKFYGLLEQKDLEQALVILDNTLNEIDNEGFIYGKKGLLVLRNTLLMNLKQENNFNNYLELIETFYKGKFLYEYFNEKLPKPTLKSLSELQAICKLESDYKNHEFFIFIDKSSNMYPYHHSLTEFMIKTLLNFDEFPFYISINYLSNKLSINEPIKDKYALISVLYANKESVFSKMSMDDIWTVFHDYKKIWTDNALRKTNIFVIGNSDLIEGKIRVFFNKRNISYYIQNNLKCHIIFCSPDQTFQSKEQLKLLQLITDKTGGLFFSVNAVEDLEHIMSDLLLIENGENANLHNKELYTKIFQKEIENLWP